MLLFFSLMLFWLLLLLLLAGSEGWRELEVEDSSKVEHRGPTVYRDS